jgi:hypothetical protein
MPKLSRLLPAATAAIAVAASSAAAQGILL